MRLFDTSVRRVLGRARRVVTRIAPPGRWSLTLATMAAVVISGGALPLPVHADPTPDPAARIQIIVKSVHIVDDTDWIGGGEERLHVVFGGPTPEGPPDDAGGLAGFDFSFDAGSGDDVALDHLTPREGEAVRGGASAEAGIPVYAGRSYNLYIQMADRDPFDATEDMGTIVVHVDEAHQWSIGTHTVRSLHEGDKTPGDYTATFEIRRTPLPDLQVTSFSVVGTPGAQNVCGEIKNTGERPAPSSSLTVQTEGKVIQTVTVPPLEVNGTYPQCVQRADLPALKHNLVFSLDPARLLPEENELNNVNFTTVEAIAGAASTEPVGTGPVAAPSPQPTGGQPEASKQQADLIVRAIQVNGQAPDGKDDCKAGKNSVTVVVKNAGKGDAGSFAVRLSVDGDDLDATADGLRAGEEREIGFDGVALKQGGHTLKAVADPAHAVSESKDDNNALKVAATCKGS